MKLRSRTPKPLLILVKMGTVLFMHDVTNQTTIYHLFIIYLSIYLCQPQAVFASLSSFRSWLFQVVSLPVWYAGFTGIKYPP
jgi:hypothetical protein